MSRTRAQFGLRSRFVAAVVTVMALVTMGSITASPASAFGNLHLIVVDASTGGAYNEKGVELNNVGGYTSTYTTYPDGTVTLGTVPTGDYIANPTDPAYFRASDQTFTMYDGGYVDHIVVFDKYRVTGSVSAGAGDGHTTATIQQDTGGGWVDQPGTFTVSNADDSFSIPVPNGPGSYRVVFHPGEELDYTDTASGAFDIVDTAASLDIGAVAFDSAPIVRGSVLTLAGSNPIAGAVVHVAATGTEVATGTSDAFGNYRVKLPAGDGDYTLYAAAAGYLPQDWNSAGLLPINATDGYTPSGIDFALDTDRGRVAGNVTYAGNPYNVDATLYKKNGSGQFDPTPVMYYFTDSVFQFDQLYEGDYRVAIYHATTGTTLPISGYSVGGTPTAPANPCFLEFSIDSSYADVVFDDVAVDKNASPATCDDPAWVDAGDASITGTVLNIDDFDSALIAKLYTGGSSGNSLADVSVVDPATGDYTFTGIRDLGEYIVKFIPTGDDAFLDTLLGLGGLSQWAGDLAVESVFATNHAFTADPADPDSLDGHDVTINEAALIKGTVFHGGSPVWGAVEIQDLGGPTLYSVDTDDDGAWALRLPAGGTYELKALSWTGEFAEQYWENTSDPDSATPIGPLTLGSFGTYDFNLVLANPSLLAYVRDVSDPNPITVHLYFKEWISDGWVEAETLESDPVYGEPVRFIQNFYNRTYDGLIPGDYRLRFQDSNGVWLAATQYFTGVLPDAGGSPLAGPSCYIDFLSVAPGFPSFIDATFDGSAQTEVCEAEPLSQGNIGGHVVSSSTWGDEDVVNHTVHLYAEDGGIYNGTSGTDSDGDFYFQSVFNGTYGLDVEPYTHVDGDHEYSYHESGIVFSGGDVDLGDLTATRYGNVYGDIDNWDDATMGESTASVYKKIIDPAGDYWEPVGLSVDITSIGHFEVPAILVDGEYALRIDFGDTYAPVYLGGGVLEPSFTFNGLAEEDYDLGTNTAVLDEFTTISGTAFYEGIPLENGLVFAHPVGACSCVVFLGVIQADGSYTIEVAPNLTYEVAAVYPQLLVQVYDGYNYPIDYTDSISSVPVEVDTDPIENIDFSLVAPDEVSFEIDLYQWDEATDTFDSFPDVDVHLYKYVIDGWDEVATFATDADAYAFLASAGDGDYRLRFSQYGEWLGIHDYSWDNYLIPWDSSDGYVTLDPAECYIEFSNLDHGSYIWSDPSLIADPLATDCGPETLADHNDITGTIVTTATWGYDTIAGQDLTLTNDATHAVFTATTDSNGVYLFENAPQGTYTLSAPTMPFLGMQFAPKTVTDIIVDGDEALDPIELVSYGAAFVTISNWDSAMAGATAQLYINHPDVGGDHWTAVGLTDTVNSTGDFIIPGIAEDGEYTVGINYPTGFVDGYLTDLTSATTILSFNGYAEINETGLDTVAYTTVSGTVHIGVAGVPGASISIESPSSDVYPTTTAANGTFSVAVPADETYSVYATKTGLVRDIITTLPVGFAPVTGANLEMHYATFLTAVYTAPAAPLSTATVHLYKQVSGGWQEVASDTSSVTYLWTNLAGNYRLRFSDGADWLAVSDYAWHNDAGTESSGLVSPIPNVCFIDFVPAIAGAEYQTEVLTLTPPTGVTCAAEPAVVAPPVTPGSTGSGKKHTAEPVTDETVTEEPEPTSTPTPEPSESPTEQPSDASSDEPPTSSSPDFTLAFWGGGALLLLLLLGGGVFFIRRRA